ncbi:AMP-binding enzyme [Thelonectria olida]|uniref:AMP-binding enzyme n=1 Tax=Thelonectria olida TaxID=1576542 RepID=A0A9P8WDT1_9HYPO|nr:AMP-binding enzyme [Thelonectria olida]
MPIESRWTEDVPNCSLQQWIFGSPFAPLPDKKIFFDADRPDSHYVTTSGYRLLAKRVALGLQRKGLKPGDRVLVFSGNNVFYPSVFLGILMAGCVFTGANPGYVARELAYQLRDSGAVAMLASADSLDTALAAANEVGLPTSSIFVFDTTVPDSGTIERPAAKGTHHWTELLASSVDAERFEWVEPSDAQSTTCCLNYSSGTTGVPKGVEVCHYSYVANCSGVVKVASLAEDHETALPRYKGICFLPMYHAYAQTYFVANFAKQGIPTYIMPNFDLVKLLSHIQRFRITHLPSVPPVLVALTKQPVSKKFDLSSLEVVGSGAAPLAPDVSTEAERLFKKPDLLVRQGWGMTEVTCTAMAWDPRRRDRGNGVGELVPNCRARLVDADGHDITSPRTPGELWICGPTVMRGYWNKPQATAETIVVDAQGKRWLRTGDIAYVDSYAPGALFYIVDRIKELIKVKGHQVAPAELEALLLERPDVADAAVIGVTIQHEEVPRAYVVRSPGTSASPDEIAEWLAAKVAKYKRLKGGVSFIEAIPKNPSGKILRKILREKAKLEVNESTIATARL